ncbi:unnamed protein product, partial [Ixodes pacificus]
EHGEESGARDASIVARAPAERQQAQLQRQAAVVIANAAQDQDQTGQDQCQQGLLDLTQTRPSSPKGRRG